MKFSTVIQARSTSSRFPGKIFSNIGDKQAIFHVIDSCLDSNCDNVILAIPKSQKEEFAHVSERYIEDKKFTLCIGSEENVLERFYDGIVDLECEAVIRITSDCFLINKGHINSSIEFFKDSNFDYINNSTVTRVLSAIIPDDYQTDTDTPDGFNVEIFTKASLLEAMEKASDRYDIEHVTPWIKRNKKCSVFNTGKISLTGKFSVDTPGDLEIVKALHTLIENNRISFEV